MTLFSSSDLKVKRSAPARDQRRRRIATGAPRLVESSTERLERMDDEAWTTLLDMIRRSSLARLDLFRGRDDADQVPCPWGRIVTCDSACRCGGATLVTVAFLRAHYMGLAAEIARITKPASAARKPS